MHFWLHVKIISPWLGGVFVKTEILQKFIILICKATSRRSREKLHLTYAEWKVCKYGVISGPYFPLYLEWIQENTDQK